MCVEDSWKHSNSECNEHLNWAAFALWKIIKGNIAPSIPIQSGTVTPNYAVWLFIYLFFQFFFSLQRTIVSMLLTRTSLWNEVNTSVFQQSFFFFFWHVVSFPGIAPWPCIDRATYLTTQPWLLCSSVFHMSVWWMPCYISQHSGVE